MTYILKKFTTTKFIYALRYNKKWYQAYPKGLKFYTRLDKIHYGPKRVFNEAVREYCKGIIT